MRIYTPRREVELVNRDVWKAEKTDQHFGKHIRDNDRMILSQFQKYHALRPCNPVCRKTSESQRKG